MDQSSQWPWIHQFPLEHLSKETLGRDCNRLRDHSETPGGAGMGSEFNADNRQVDRVKLGSPPQVVAKYRFPF